jgi:hypothetical protein
MKTRILFPAFAAFVIFMLLLGSIPARVVQAGPYDPCPPGTGPGGITAGSYDPTLLSQDQRQWLFQAFGHAGIAPVGYGGEECGKTPPSHPAWFGQGCGTSYTGPGGLRAGGYDPTSLSQDQRQWLFEVFGNEGFASVGYGGQTCDWQNPPPSHSAWFGQGCGTSYAGPGGLRAGGYDPNSLGQDQKQWLFEVFGNEGTAPIGYGGQTCDWQNVPPQHPAWFGQGCNTSYTGPSGLRAGGYDATTLSQDQRQWLFEVFGNEGTASVGYGGNHCSWQDQSIVPSCPSGTGPGGITAGSYDPTKLTQDQRQWLFSIFGNNGIAPVGYGGQTCTGGTLWQPGSSSTPTCPSGMGPGSITAGSYDPTKLTQDQRQWLFTIFGNNGIAPVGYGGQTCTGGTSWQPGGSSTPTCPGGTGPGGITAGSYDPTLLTQDQRQWLFYKFGNNGVAPVGYGGQTCLGGTPWQPSTSNGNTGNQPSGQTSNPSINNNPNDEPFAGDVIQKEPRPWYCYIPFVCPEQIEAVDTECHPQCMDTAYAQRQDLSVWATGADYPVTVLSLAENRPQFSWPSGGSVMMQVHVRTDGEQILIKDLVIWPTGCGEGVKDGIGHIAVVVNTNPLLISDSNWGAPTGNICASRNNVSIPQSQLGCVKFISSPEPIPLGQTQPQITIWEKISNVWTNIWNFFGGK